VMMGVGMRIDPLVGHALFYSLSPLAGRGLG